MTTELALDFLKFFLPLIGAVWAWYFNERRKRVEEEYVRKERKYEALIEGLRGFYSNNSNSGKGNDLKQRFLDELEKSWLYCPDEVIEKAYRFLDTVRAGANEADAEKEAAVGELMLAIRRDLLSREPTKATQLTSKTFRLLQIKRDGST